MNAQYLCKECNKQYVSAKALSDHRLYMRKQGQGHATRILKKDDDGICIEKLTNTHDSKSTTLESLFAVETSEQIKARKEAQALIEAEPNLQSLMIDPERTRSIQIQNTAIFYETPKVAKTQCFHSPVSSQDNESSNEKSKVISYKLWAKETKFWNPLKDIKRTNNFQAFWQLSLCYELAICTLVVLRKTKPQGSQHTKVIAECFTFLQNQNGIPIELAEYFRSFFNKLDKKQFELLTCEHLRSLFKLCREIQADVQWIKEIKEPYILFDLASVKGSADAVHVLLKHKQHYSLEYFIFIDLIIQNRIFASMIKDFDSILNVHVIVFDLPWSKALCQFSNIINRDERKDAAKQTLEKLLKGRQGQINISKLLIALEVALELSNINDVSALMAFNFNSKEELQKMIEEQIISMTQTQIKHFQLNEAKKVQETRQKEQQKLEDEEEEKQKQQIIQLQIKERQQYKEDLTFAERQFQLANMTDQNQFKSKELQAIFERDLKVLPTKMNEVLGKLKLVPRAEQLVVLNILLRSNKKFTIIQLGTGFGKSRGIVGPLSDAARWATKMKSIVIVPTKILRTTNQDYCIAANQAEIELTETDCINTFYCTFAQFLQLQHLIPANSNIFVDEGHLYFKEKVIQVEGKAVVPTEVLKKFTRVYILSATFGGQESLAELQRYLNDSLFIHSPAELNQKDLSQVEVFGNMTARDEVLRKAVEVAKLKLKEYPVVLFCKDDEECAKLKEQFEKARIFGEWSDIAELLDIISESKNVSNALVILTTQKACIGIDFIFKVLRAFVILTEDANYLEELLQPIGRSSRVDKNLPLLGAILTSIDCQSIESLEKSLKDKAVEIKLFGKTARDNMAMLNACPAARNQNQLQRLEGAIASFNSVPNQSIKNNLLSIPDFKKAIDRLKNSATVFCNNSSSLVSICWLFDQNQRLLKKRNLRDSSNDSNFSSSNEAQMLKRRKIVEKSQWENIQIKDKEEDITFQEMLLDEEYAPRVDDIMIRLNLNEQQLQINHEISAFQEENFATGSDDARKREFDEVHHAEEAKTAKECLEAHQKFHKQNSSSRECSICKAKVEHIYFCSTCTFVFCGKCQNGNQNNYLNDEVNAFQEFMEINNQHQVDPKALKQKELEEAVAVLEQHGFIVPVKKYKGALSFISEKKAATVFGERDLGGRFKPSGGTQIGNYQFKKDGFLRGIQNWQCLRCKKKTTKPELHACV